jgi:hypothetical protein
MVGKFSSHRHATVSAAFLAAATTLFITAPATAQSAVLYDQTDSPATSASVSDDYTDRNDLDEQIADDFTVPAGESWQISQIDVTGAFSTDGTLPPTVNVFLYANSGTLPGTQLFSQSGPATGGPNYSIPVSGAPALIPGTYWVSVQQAGAADNSLDIWYWGNRSTQSGNPAAYRNPGGGRVASCTDWGVKVTCLGGDPLPDQIFKLSGTSTPYSAPPPDGTAPDGTTPPPALAEFTRTLRLGYSEKKDKFKGKLESQSAACIADQKVKVLKKKKGRDPKLGRDLTNEKGKYSLKEKKAEGKFYAKVKERSISTGTCLAAKSKTIKVG